nr:serine/threonine-protein kinase [Anaerolineaceae bacterium]
MTDITKLGKYEILEDLGRGGFGVVYKARDTVLDRVVAVKVLHPNLVNDLSFVSRFRNEARLAAQLDHPNIVPVHDFGESEGLYYIVMGHMPGGSLKELLQKEGALPEEKALAILRQVSDGLSYAHRKGIIHRDLKPGNILFDEEGEARVSDLGFAKLLHSDSSSSLTMSGGVVGTPAYMAPEIWKGLPATPAVDVY